jgi:hypothetical protein
MQPKTLRGSCKSEGWGFLSLRFSISCLSLGATLLFATAACAQSGSLEASANGPDSLSLPALPATTTSSASALPAAPVASSWSGYVQPTEDQKFHSYLSNAVGPVAFAGASIAGAIDQAFNFPHHWGQGFDAYGARVSSNLGISMVTATAQYSIAEAFHEDTAYYHCTCKGFLPRFWHAAYSSVTARSGSDGHRVFSPALTVSPMIGPLVAANTWIPSRNGAALGLRMGVHNLMGQFAQDEALEFLTGPQNHFTSRFEHLFRRSSSALN